MLQRIYGISFPEKSQLEAYLFSIEEAKKYDHNKIGRELGYFTTVNHIGQGLPILMPNGAKVIQILQRFIEDEEEKQGYFITKTPLLAKSDLYKISGHWQHYKENMFILNDKEKDREALALRPMTCPFQFQVYLAKSRSYRDLPMRLAETSTVFRNEASGEMHGLIRLRQFTLSDGHIICTSEQLENEFLLCVKFARYVLKTLGLEEDIFYRLSKWDKNNKEKYIGNAKDWENSQNKMCSILDNLNINYEEVDGEAAFYGPKLDFQIKNVHGKEDTLITVQIDFQLAERFKIEYTDSDGKKKYPYIIHRTSLGCYERTLALLLEKYKGALPFWLMPEQIRILPISEKVHNFSHKIKSKLEKYNIRSSIDLRNEKIGYKIREAEKAKIPYMFIIGEIEAEKNGFSIRTREKGEISDSFMTVLSFIKYLQNERNIKIYKSSELEVE
jgi:threonyl-tRNA synthetase